MEDFLNVKMHVQQLQVTYADLAVAVLLEVLSQQKPELLAAFTNLGRIKRSVEDLPNIKAWIAKRPASDL